MSSITREELPNRIGTKLETTEWHTVDQTQIQMFADGTLDQQYIHTNPELAAKTPFGTTIAHGFLSLSMLAYFAESFGVQIEGAYMGINYGFNKVRFLTPVKVDSRIRCNATLVDAIEKNPGQFMITFNVEIEIEGEDKPALIAEWITMQMVK